jgi:hypothetical protein
MSGQWPRHEFDASLLCEQRVQPNEVQRATVHIEPYDYYNQLYMRPNDDPFQAELGGEG